MSWILVSLGKYSSQNSLFSLLILQYQSQTCSLCDCLCANLLLSLWVLACQRHPPYVLSSLSFPLFFFILFLSSWFKDHGTLAVYLWNLNFQIKMLIVLFLQLKLLASFLSMFVSIWNFTLSLKNILNN